MDRNSVLGGKLVSVLLITFLFTQSAYAESTVMAGKVVSVEGRVLIRQDHDQDAGSGGASAATAMRAGIDIKEGDVINTSSDGKAKILLADKTILDIGPSALFKVQKFDVKHGGDRNVDLSMPYGTTRVSVSKPIAAGGKFQIRTRTATMGVRGTEFVVQSELGSGPLTQSGKGGKEPGQSGKGPDKASETKITVIQGKVEVSQTSNKKEDAKMPGETASRKLASVAPASVMLTAGTQLTASADAPAAKPVKLDSVQLSAVSTASKVQDNTFSNAVTMDLSGNGKKDSNGNGGGTGGSGAGAATLAALNTAITAPLTQTLAQSSSGFIGAPSNTNLIPQNVVVIPPGGGVFKLHIVVKQ